MSSKTADGEQVQGVILMDFACPGSPGRLLEHGQASYLFAHTWQMCASMGRKELEFWEGGGGGGGRRGEGGGFAQLRECPRFFCSFSPFKRLEGRMAPPFLTHALVKTAAPPFVEWHPNNFHLRRVSHMQHPFRIYCTNYSHFTEVTILLLLVASRAMRLHID